jgi:hypothetical protein
LTESSSFPASGEACPPPDTFPAGKPCHLVTWFPAPSIWSIAVPDKTLSGMMALQPKVSNRQIAKTLGVGSRTIDRDIAPNGAPRGKKANKTKGGGAPNGALSGTEAARVVAADREGAGRR